MAKGAASVEPMCADLSGKSAVGCAEGWPLRWGTAGMGETE